MKLLINRQFLPWWLLIVSLAFNLGFGATYSIRSLGVGNYSKSGQGLGGGTMSMVYAHEGLNLTTEQAAQIQSINENLMAEIHQHRDQLRAARVTLAELLSQTELNAESVTIQLDLINTIQRAAQQLVVDHLLQEKELLHPDQLGAFDEIIRNRVCPGSGTGGFGPGAGRGNGDGSGMGRRDGSGRGIGKGLGQHQDETIPEADPEIIT